MRPISSTLLVLGAFALPLGLFAADINYPNFSDVSNLQINGDAAQVGNVLRVTPSQAGQSGSVFSKTAIQLNNLKQFSTRFQFNISNPGGISDNDGQGADGIVFVAQTVANTAGGAGGGIGYQGLLNSVGVEFDTWNNGAQDGNNGNHVGIDLNGSVNSAVRAAVADRMNNGLDWTAWVDYNGTTLEVRLNETGTRPINPYLTYDVDLAGVLGSANAFVGFTSGTGSAYGDHDILNWTFRSEYKPIGSVPEAGSTLALLALGLASLGCYRRQS